MALLELVLGIYQVSCAERMYHARCSQQRSWPFSDKLVTDVYLLGCIGLQSRYLAILFLYCGVGNFRHLWKIPWSRLRVSGVVATHPCPPPRRQCFSLPATACYDASEMLRRLRKQGIGRIDEYSGGIGRVKTSTVHV